MFFGNAGGVGQLFGLLDDASALGRADPPAGSLVRRRFLEGSPRAAGCRADAV